MDKDKAQLIKDLEDAEERVREQEKRIPPHSVRPHQLMELERLEEERDLIAEKLRQMETD